jgi:hypothetical protein
MREVTSNHTFRIQKCQDGPTSTFSAASLRAATGTLCQATPSATLSLDAWRRTLSACCNPMGCRQRCSRPGNELLAIVEQPLRRTPEGEVNSGPFLEIVEGWIGFRFLESRPTEFIYSEIQRVVGHHTEHYTVAEHTSLSEHSTHRHLSQRRELLPQEFGECSAGNHETRNVSEEPRTKCIALCESGDQREQTQSCCWALLLNLVRRNERVDSCQLPTGPTRIEKCIRFAASARSFCWYEPYRIRRSVAPLAICQVAKEH